MTNKTKISKKECVAFLNEVAKRVPSRLKGDDGEEYISTFDGSYITHVGIEEDVAFMVEHGITQEIQATSENSLVAQIGYSPSENKWFGWSHRAKYGFGIGSECKYGMVHYIPDTKERYIQSLKDFYSSEYHDIEALETQVSPERPGILIRFHYNDKVPNPELQNSVTSTFHEFPDKWGRGEWTAKTMADAKQMAIDFARGIS